MSDKGSFRRAAKVTSITALLLAVTAAGYWAGGGPSAPAAMDSDIEPAAMDAGAPVAPIDPAPGALRTGAVVEPDPAREEALRRELEAAFTDYQATELPADGDLREFELVAAEAEIALVSGLPELEGVGTQVWAYNGQVPGPELRVNLGDTVRVTLDNRLPADTTIHWHGVRVPNDMDGVPVLTQEPVAPGQRFVYEFTPREPGTYWYHPHVRSSEELERGLYGVLVVEDPDEPEYSRDLVWVLDDWLLQADGQIVPEFNTGGELMHDGRWGNLVTVSSQVDETLVVQPGERLRLRLVNTANGRIFMPDFASLDVKVIAIDGVLVETPFVPDRLELAPGNRIDLDVTIDPALAGQTLDVVDQATGQAARLAGIEVAGEVVQTPGFEAPRNPRIPTWEAAKDVSADGELVLDAARGGPLGIAWRINGRAYPEFDPVSLPHGRFSKLRIVNNSGRLHPMHMHGQFFQVLSRNGAPADERSWRDTVLVYPNETIDIGLVPVDRGSWATHCHILEHAAAGMLTVTEVE